MAAINDLLRQIRERAQDPAPFGQFKEFRADGWPFCPQCEDDELWSRAHMAWDGSGEKPTVEHGIRSGMKCYRCGWESAEFKVAR